MYETIALILAGGKGLRFDSSKIPKQYIRLHSNTILDLAINKFLSHDKIDAVQVVIGQDHQDFYHFQNNHAKLLPIAFGGKRRQDSVYHGLEAVKKFSPKFILIHDAVRPFLSEQLISNVIDNLQDNLAVIPAINIVDSIVEIRSDRLVRRCVSREKMCIVQTPQGFHYMDILKCHQLERGRENTFTDDSSLAIKYNLPVIAIDGERSNIKITFKEDLHERS